MIDDGIPRHATGNHYLSSFFTKLSKILTKTDGTRLAVSSRKNDLKGGADIDEKLDDYIAFSRHNISSGASLQNQAYKDVSKQDDKLKSFSKEFV